MHLDGPTNHWFATHAEQFPRIAWLDFVSKVTLRFVEIVRDNVIAEFNKFRQMTNIKEYHQ